MTADLPDVGERRDVDASPPRPWAASVVLATGAAVCFVALSLAVVAGATDDLDRQVRELFRPDDVWSTNQLVFGNVVDGLGPPVAVGLLLLAGVVAAWRHGSWRPLGEALVLAAVAGCVIGVTKLVFHREDPHGAISTLGGAYPSGHMVMLLVSLGGALLLLRRTARSWWWIPVALAEVLMGVSLLFLAMHWFTDVVGGALLGLVLVCLANAVGPGRLEVGGG